MVSSATAPVTPPAQRTNATSERPSLFGRLSLSPSKRGPKTKSAMSQALSSNSLQDAAAGPSYESQSHQFRMGSPQYVAPSVERPPVRSAQAGNVYPATPRAAPIGPANHLTGAQSIEQSGRSALHASRSASFTRPAQPVEGDGSRTLPISTQSPTTSPPRQRQPIYPALASPPRNRLVQANSPPPVAHQWHTSSHHPARTPGEITIDTNVATSPPRRKSSPRVSTLASSCKSQYW